MAGWGGSIYVAAMTHLIASSDQPAAAQAQNGCNDHGAGQEREQGYHRSKKRSATGRREAGTIAAGMQRAYIYIS